MHEYGHQPRFEKHISLLKSPSNLESFFRIETIKRGEVLSRLVSSTIHPENYSVFKKRYGIFCEGQAYIIGNRIRTENNMTKSPDYKEKARQTVVSALRFIRPFTETQRANFYRNRSLHRNLPSIGDNERENEEVAQTSNEKKTQSISELDSLLILQTIINNQNIFESLTNQKVATSLQELMKKNQKNIRQQLNKYKDETPVALVNQRLTQVLTWLNANHDQLLDIVEEWSDPYVQELLIHFAELPEESVTKLINLLKKNKRTPFPKVFQQIDPNTESDMNKSRRRLEFERQFPTVTHEFSIWLKTVQEKSPTLTFPITPNQVNSLFDFLHPSLLDQFKESGYINPIFQNRLPRYSLEDVLISTFVYTSRRRSGINNAQLKEFLAIVHETLNKNPQEE